MGNITLKDITPKYFFDVVKLLKFADYDVYCTIDSVEIRFRQKQFLMAEETEERFDFCYSLKCFLDELKNSDVPIDLQELFDKYEILYSDGGCYYRRKY